MAVSTGGSVAYVFALYGLLIFGPAAVTILKGQWIYLIAGFFTVGIVWWIVAFRLARPTSRWARRFYGPEKLQRAEARYGAVTAAEESA